MDAFNIKRYKTDNIVITFTSLEKKTKRKVCV